MVWCALKAKKHHVSSVRRTDSYTEALLHSTRLVSRSASEMTLDRDTLDIPLMSSRNSSIVSDISYQDAIQINEFGSGKISGTVRNSYPWTVTTDDKILSHSHKS